MSNYEQIKDEVAKRLGYDSFQDVENSSVWVCIEICDQAAEIYIQREKAELIKQFQIYKDKD